VGNQNPPQRLLVVDIKQLFLTTQKKIGKKSPLEDFGVLLLLTLGSSLHSKRKFQNFVVFFNIIRLQNIYLCSTILVVSALFYEAR
jgi:hypothetical protein